MPVRRSNYIRRRPKKGRRGRRYGRRKGRSLVSRPIRSTTAFPQHVFLKLNYVETRLVNLAAGADNTYVYSLNSLYDPNVTGTGHQPLSFDQWSNMYSSYRVYGCRVIVRMTVSLSLTTAVFSPIFIMYAYPATVTPPGTADTVCENKGSVSRVVLPGDRPVVLRKYYDIATVFGVGKAALRSEANYAATTTANPAQQAYIAFKVINNDATSTLTITYNTEFKYYCKLFTPTMPSSS